VRVLRRRAGGTKRTLEGEEATCGGKKRYAHGGTSRACRFANSGFKVVAEARQGQSAYAAPSGGRPRYGHGFLDGLTFGPAWARFEFRERRGRSEFGFGAPLAVHTDKCLLQDRWDHTRRHVQPSICRLYAIYGPPVRGGFLAVSLKNERWGWGGVEAGGWSHCGTVEILMNTVKPARTN